MEGSSLKYSAHCVFDLKACSRSDVLEELLEFIPINGNSLKLIHGALEMREQAGPTIISPGISIPHCRSILVDDLTVVVGRSTCGVPWPEEPVKVMIMFISPVKPDGPHEHLAFISHVASRIKKSAEAVLNASSAESLLELLGMEPILGGVDEP